MRPFDTRNDECEYSAASGSSSSVGRVHPLCFAAITWDEQPDTSAQLELGQYSFGRCHSGT